METAFFPSVSESKTIPFLEQRGLCGGGCWAGPTRSTGHHLCCVALSPGHETGTSSPSQLPRHSPAYRYPGGWVSPHKCWTFIITWSVRLQFFCSICTCHKFQKVTVFPSISDFDDQVVCFIHAVHHCLCVFKNLNISYMKVICIMYLEPCLSNPHLLGYLLLPLKSLVVPKRSSPGITGPEILT